LCRFGLTKADPSLLSAQCGLLAAERCLAAAKLRLASAKLLLWFEDLCRAAEGIGVADDVRCSVLAKVQ
jgi:hypothetical protein